MQEVTETERCGREVSRPFVIGRFRVQNPVRRPVILTEVLHDFP
jgi:hypothetical protein